jgi:hypothetical protein
MLHGDLTTGRRAYRGLELVRLAQAGLSPELLRQLEELTEGPGTS